MFQHEVLRRAGTHLKHLFTASRRLHGALSGGDQPQTYNPRSRTLKTNIASSRNNKRQVRRDCDTSLTVCKCIQQLSEKLRQYSIPESKSSAEHIVAHVCGHKTVSSVSAGRVLTSAEYDAVWKLTEKRLKSMPLQYVLGEWDFLDQTLVMRQPVFIARPETEELVNHCVSSPAFQDAGDFLEVGSGSGVISISLLSKLPQCQATCIDQSEAACDLTRENAELAGVSDRLNILHCVFNRDIILKNFSKFDFIISNPPYIPSSELESLPPEITQFEDIAALDGGTRGLDVIDDILHVARYILKPNGSVWLETDSTHPEVIREIVKNNTDLQLKVLRVRRDFQGIERFVHLVHEGS